MSNMDSQIDDHERFVEFCAISPSGLLSKEERRELELHLAGCADCRGVYVQFASVVRDGLPLVAPDHAQVESDVAWDHREQYQKLTATIDAAREKPETTRRMVPSLGWLRVAMTAACLAVIGGTVGFMAGRRQAPPPQIRAIAPASPNLLSAASTTNLSPSDEKLKASLVELEGTEQAQKSKIKELETKLETTRIRLASVETESSASVLQLQQLRAERDGLTVQLRNAQEQYQKVQLELNSIQEQRRQDLLHMAALESGNQALNARIQEQDRVIAERDQYLSSDRDIRELMGARQLYIADVFDIDGSGTSRKPFGRVFYTKNRSLIFYAFDLDQQAQVKNASIFQVWGQRDFGHGKPLNLGIMYMDNATNRRWVLRLDDPAKLASIDAVFVTVEPNGGSQKPTGKQLLYASLRKAPNHP